MPITAAMIIGRQAAIRGNVGSQQRRILERRVASIVEPHWLTALVRNNESPDPQDEKIMLTGHATQKWHDIL